ncbi:MAG: hypothetical protein K940chlam5_00049 [Candidatus Anoxychlamydiales bacterium]|nr:hypothetical protein [Candidatus Anoxychlamydiales bacterium]
MKVIFKISMKRYIYFLLAIFFLQAAFARDPFEGKQEEPDMDALRKWVREKRMISIKELGGDLSLSGEVRVEYQGFNEKKNGIKQRGISSATSNPNNAFDVEVNLILDYHSGRTWGIIKLEFDNDMGIDSGTTHEIALEKAYFGGRMIDGETFNFDGELGRRNLSDVFDSKIEFSSIFDGGLFRFNKAFESIGSFYVNLGAFLISDFYKHFGEVTEIGLLDIANTGFFVKYSFINWKKFFDSDGGRKRRFNFGNSQLLLGYQGIMAKWDKYTKIYLAGLMNHFAKDLTFANDVNLHKKYNLAWYVGISVGRILQARDWAIDVNFQYVMPQAVSDFDAGGITTGNADNVGLYTTSVTGTGNPTTRADAVGEANYKGFSFDFLYAITNNLTLLQRFEISNNQTRSFGPAMSFKKYEMEFIYAF